MLRPLFNIISLLFTMGTVLLLFFVILGGVKDHGVLSKFYYFRAETGSIIDNAPGISQWSLWGYCGYDGTDTSNPGSLLGCTEHHPAFGFDIKSNFESNVPEPLANSKNRLYYESRFFFPFLLIGLFFQVVTMFITLFANASIIVSTINWLSNFISWVFITVAAALITAFNVKARSAFNDSGSQSVRLGRYVLGFVWACVFMTLVQFVLLCWIRPRKQTSGTYGAESGAYVTGTGKSHRFGIRSKKTTEVNAFKDYEGDAAERSSYVRA